MHKVLYLIVFMIILSACHANDSADYSNVEKELSDEVSFDVHIIPPDGLTLTLASIHAVEAVGFHFSNVEF
ncbi:hypothetical protein [Alkalibacillus silvisoli]|uniref:Uncharacterized protein n=1 Tax=Alkalibacillus silvisoli TaxID=392823 RepID=A0ABN0ZPA0_9BACI